ncbi:MAG: hypothetical protein ACKV2Q_32865 [Planctomycetaceae bacterium]
MTRQHHRLGITTISWTCVVLGVALIADQSFAENPMPPEVLRGRIKQLSHSLERTSVSLEESDLPEFVCQFQRLSSAYIGVAESTEQCFRDLGAARIKVRIARKVLAGLETSDAERQLERERVDQIQQGVQAGRDVLLARLAEIKPATPETVATPGTLSQMQQLVERIEQLDHLVAAGESTLTNAESAQNLAAPLDAIERQLAEDEQVLKLQARMISELVEQRTRAMQRALGYLELTASLPETEVRLLRDARRNLRGLVEQIDAARTATRGAVKAESERPIVDEPHEAQQLHERAEALLAPRPARSLTRHP